MPCCAKGVRRSPATITFVVAVAMFMDSVVYGIGISFIPAFVAEKFGASPLETGVLFAAMPFGIIASTPAVGYCSDRFGRRLPMLLGLAGMAGSTVLLALPYTLWVMIIGRILQGVSSAVTWVAGLALMADVYEPSALSGAMGIAMSVSGVGMLVGPIVGGVLYQYGGYQIWIPYAFCGGLAVFDFLARMLLIDDASLAVLVAEKKSKVAQSLQDTTANVNAVAPVAAPSTDVSFGMLMRDPPTVMASLANALSAVLLGGIEPIFPPYFAEKFDLPPASISYTFAIIVGGFILSSAVTGVAVKYVGNVASIAIGTIVLAATVACIALPPQLWAACCILGAMGFSTAVAQNPVLAEVAACVDRLGGGSYGRVYSILNTSYSVGLLVGPVLTTALVEKIHFEWAMVALAAMLTAFVPVYLVVIFVHKRTRRRLGGDAEKAPLLVNVINVTA